MRHVYITSLVDGAALAAELAVLLGPEGSEPHVYRVEPTGPYVDDPNVTDKKFPGNPTQSYRSTAPLRILEEITDWTRLEPAELDLWRERLAANSETTATLTPVRMPGSRPIVGRWPAGGARSRSCRLRANTLIASSSAFSRSSISPAAPAKACAI